MRAPVRAARRDRKALAPLVGDRVGRIQRRRRRRSSRSRVRTRRASAGRNIRDRRAGARSSASRAWAEGTARGVGEGLFRGRGRIRRRSPVAIARTRRSAATRKKDLATSEISSPRNGSTFGLSRSHDGGGRRNQLDMSTWLPEYVQYRMLSIGRRRGERRCAAGRKRRSKSHAVARLAADRLPRRARAGRRSIGKKPLCAGARGRRLGRAGCSWRRPRRPTTKWRPDRSPPLRSRRRLVHPRGAARTHDRPACGGARAIGSCWWIA